MGESKHTPGPWKCDEVRTQVGRAFRIGSGEMLDAGKGCCIIYDDYPGTPDNERAASARLIAAAPDMLAMLRECRATFAFAAGEGDDPAHDFIAEIDAVLAKAEGR